MLRKRKVPLLVVLFPLAGSVIFRALARVADLPGDSPLGISWVGSLELLGLVLGALVALVVVFRSPVEPA
jgi:hypothetical protein